MIYVENLRKEFKKTIKEPGLKGSLKSFIKPKKEIVAAVKDISFDVNEDEILGFIGPNGAGKSTVIKMLTGILTPTSGKCTINGKDPQKDRKKYVKEIGVVFGQRTQLWWDLPLTDMVNDFVKYPIDIYNNIVRSVLTYIIPFAFTAYFPALYFLTGENPLFNIGMTIVVALIVMTIGVLIWNRGIKAYESAGS